MVILKQSLLGLVAQAAIAVAKPGPFKALPGVLDNRAACNRDNCLRAIIASNAKPGSASASADCVSFFRKTVTPCPSDAPTTSVTVVTTVVVDAPTTTEVVLVTYTAATTPINVDVTYTVTPTTVTVPTTVATVESLVTKTETVTNTITENKTKTVYTPTSPPTTKYEPAPPVMNRRQAGVGQLDARNPDACTQTQAPSVVPTYASACSGTVRYSSACSCISVSQTTITATLPTVTATVTDTSYSTPATVTNTQTNSIPVTETVYNTVSHRVDVTATAFESITATTTRTTTAFETQLKTETVTATVTSGAPGPTTYCSMYLRASSGVMNGQYVRGVNGLLVFQQNSAQPKATFQFLPGQSYLFSPNVYGPNSIVQRYADAAHLYYATPGQMYFNPLLCTVNSATLELSCSGAGTGSNPRWSSYYTDDGFGKYVLYGGTNPPQDITKIFVEPVNCVTP